MDDINIGDSEIKFKTADMKKFAEHYQKIVIDNKRLHEENEKLDKEIMRLNSIIEALQNVK